MRGYSGILVLLLIAGACASTFNINSLETIRASKENLTITYSIILDNPETTTYIISLNSIPILSNTESFKETSQTLNYNVSNIPAGNYALTLKVNNTAGSITASAPANITIQREVSMQASTPGKIYTGGSEANSQAAITNNGNTDLDISAYFRNAQSEITLIPQSFQLGMSETRNVVINVKKPGNDYTATLTIIATNQQDEIKKNTTYKC